jgi:hypothetical protein
MATSTTTALDLTKQPPRSGRVTLGRYAWLARLADKARAQHAGTQDSYIAYCPLSMGFLDRVGITKQTFETMIAHDYDDERLIGYFDEHVTDEQRAEANRFILDEHGGDLDEQDAEESTKEG